MADHERSQQLAFTDASLSVGWLLLLVVPHLPVLVAYHAQEA